MEINILEKKEIMTSLKWVEKALEIDAIIMYIGVFIWLILLLALIFIFDKKNLPMPKKIIIPLLNSVGVLMGIGIILAIGFEVCRNIIKVPTGKYEYKVTVEDDTSFKYIHDNYDVISNEDDVWILRDK